MKAKKLIATALCCIVATGAAYAQRDWGCSAEDQQACMEPVTLYQQNMKDYKSSKDARYLKEAYPYWKTIVSKCPKQSKNLYLNGVTIIRGLMTLAQTQEEQDALLTELLGVYDTRIANYGEAAEVTARKANELETLRKDAALKQYYELYAEAVRIGDTNLDANWVVKYMESTIRYVKAGMAEPTLVVDNYDVASDLLDKELQQSLADTNHAKKLRGYIAGLEQAFSPYANCEQLVAIYEKKVEADPTNVDLLKKVTSILMRKGCSETPLFFTATEKLYALEPSPSTALRMGQMSFSKKQYADAEKYLSDAVKGLTETKDLYRAYILLGHAQNERNQLTAARTSFQKAAQADPSKGEPYLLIASLYAKGSHSISDGMGGRSAYWAAVDKARKAKEVDNSDEVVEAANKMIGTFSAYFPKKADAFMLNILDGQGYHVGGWIGESTTVRTR